MTADISKLRARAAQSDMRTTQRTLAVTEAMLAAAQVRPFLLVVAGFRLGDCIPLARGRQLIGRDRTATVYLPDESVSRIHGAFVVGAREVQIEDLDSTNGCLVNGLATPSTQLRNGDEIALGDVVLRYYDSTCREGAYHLALYEQTSRDPLTGLLNRRCILQRAADALALATSLRQSIAVVMVDTDRFKPVNDRYGHAVGDRLLQQIADALRCSLRGDSFLGRLGGDEFLAVLSDVDARTAQIVGVRVNARVRALTVEGLTDFGRPSVTIGVALSDPLRSETIDALIDRADQAMLEAKRQGRDRLVMAGAVV